MDIQKCTKPAFHVIGKEGSTDQGQGFVQRLWEDANRHFAQIEPLVKKDDHGTPVGIWGAMSDPSRAFRPWEDDYTRGLYLAGAEVQDDAQPPEGWTKWTIPSFAYLTVRVEGESGETFRVMIAYMQENGLSLAGAVQDFICPAENGQPYMYFPIQRR